MRLARERSRGWSCLVCCLVGGAAVALPAVADAQPKAKVKPTVAVLYFDYDGKDEELGHLRKGLTQMLVSDLAGQGGYDVVERVRLENVINELDLGQTRKIDRATAAKIGKLLGARYLVLGGYFDFKGTLRIDARLVEVETGKVLESFGGARKLEDFLDLEMKLSADLGKYLVDQIAIQADALPASRRPRAPRRLPAKVAAQYGDALDAIDHGDKERARRGLKQVVDAQPDFEMAAVDLSRLAQ